jgi:predicted RNA-binding Zn-ribbon protein involved in translation (DUF1610 family)
MICMGCGHQLTEEEVRQGHCPKCGILVYDDPEDDLIFWDP